MIKIAVKKIRRLSDICRGLMVKKLKCNYDLNKYSRVYLIHIRKTAGTSLNQMFLSLAGGDPRGSYKMLAEDKNHRIDLNGLIFVGWNRFYIDSGQYFYAFSHIPVYNLSLPERTYTVTCFRDPVERVISHYKMLRCYEKNRIDHPCMKVEGKWLGEGFEDFLDNIPKEHLLNQLYMFDAGFNIDAAIERVSKVSNVIFIDEFDSGVGRINRDLGLELKPIHARKIQQQFDIPSSAINRLKRMVELESAFLDSVRDLTVSNKNKNNTTLV